MGLMTKEQREIDEFFGNLCQYAVQDGREMDVFRYNDVYGLATNFETISASGQVFVGPMDDMQHCYVQLDVDETGLALHKTPDGEWKDGRLILKNEPERYHVWLGFDRDLTEAERKTVVEKFNAEQGRGPERWTPFDLHKTKVLHAGLQDEHEQKLSASEFAVQPEKGKAAEKMDPVFEKLSRFFHEYEIGVYKEARTDNEKGAVWTVEDPTEKQGYLRAMNAQGKHVFIRPAVQIEPYYMMQDDLDCQTLERQHKENGRYKPGRLVVESSPGNYQVWIRSDRPISNEEKAAWLKKLQSDPGASPKRRWGRCPGFRNRKDKYEQDGKYPLAKLIWVDWKNKARIPKIEMEPTEPQNSQPKEAGPRLGRGSTAGLPSRDDYYKGFDKKGKIRESEQDFAYALALLRRGVARHEIQERISSERTDWSNHQGENRRQAYLEKTLDKAESIIDPYVHVISIKDKAKNRERLIEVEEVPQKDARKFLEDKAKAEALKLGFDKKEDLSISIDRVKRKKKLGIEQGHAQGQCMQL